MATMYHALMAIHTQPLGIVLSVLTQELVQLGANQQSVDTHLAQTLREILGAIDININKKPQGSKVPPLCLAALVVSVFSDKRFFQMIHR